MIRYLYLIQLGHRDLVFTMLCIGLVENPKLVLELIALHKVSKRKYSVTIRLIIVPFYSPFPQWGGQKQDCWMK
jgi:hypothetical protein